MAALGIGIVTYNRCDLLAQTIDSVRAMTRERDALLMVADDGSTDGTLAMAREKRVPVVTGQNRGVAWNKNRALFTLHEVFRCDVVILMEDDTQPAEAGWDGTWMAATRRWGHVSYLPEARRPSAVAGDGTPDDPYICTSLTAQCCGYAWAALAWGGYFDPRFHGFGHEHVEHTARLSRAGFGGRIVAVDGVARQAHEAITGGVAMRTARSHFVAEAAERNLTLAHELLRQQEYRAPWRDEAEMRRFRAEVDAALQDGAPAFRLHPPAGSHPPAPAPRLKFIGSP